jgi:hypothetical protein
MSNQPMIEDIREHADALEAKFGFNTDIAYSNVRNTQLSIARIMAASRSTATALSTTQRTIH